MSKIRWDNGKITTVEEYIAINAKSIEQFIIKVRKLIRKILPQFKESLFFTIPTYQYRNEFIAFRPYNKNMFNLFLSQVLIARDFSYGIESIVFWNNSLLFEKTSKKEIDVVKALLLAIRETP